MPSIRRNGLVASPSPQTAPVKPSEVDEAAPAGWVGQAKSRDTLPQTVTSAESTAASMTPQLGPIAPAPMLKALGNGNATIDVPLKAGAYKVKGVSFTVKPGTVAHVNVQVKDGELVPVGHGQQGTSMKIDPPLDLPLWVTGQGAELKGDAAKQKFEVELGGFFDVSFKAKKLSDLISSGDARPSSSASSASSPLAGLATQMLDLSKVKVDAKVTLREASLDLGGAKVQVDPTTTFSVKGDGQHATLSGHVQLDGFGLDQAGTQLVSKGGGQAELSTSIDRVAGGYQLDSRLGSLKLSLDKLTHTQPSALVPGKMDKISLGPTEIHDGEVRLTTKLGMNGLTPTGFSKPLVAMSFKASGTLEDVQLTVKDAKDSATASVRGQFSGDISLGPDGAKFDAQLTGAHVDVRDLQEVVQGNQVSIERAVADGDVHFTNAPGKLLIDGDAKNLDIVVDDFKGGSATVKTDLGRTTVTGDGKFSVGTAGVHADGHLHGSAVIDSASFTAGKGRSASLGSSTLSGDLTRLDLGKGPADLRLENVTADLGVQRASFDVGQATVGGSGRVKASGTVVLNANGFSLDGKGQVSMKLDDGRVHSSTVDLSLAKGSGAELTINELSLGKTTSVKVGPGSRLDAVIAGGTLQVAGTSVELERGGRAQLTVKSADVSGGKTDLRGSVKLDARVKAGQVVAPVDAHGVKIHPADVEGRVKVSIDDVHLADDRLSFKNAQVSLDATVGRYVGIATPGQPGIGSLQDPVPVLSAADVKKSTAAQLAGVTPPVITAGSPVEALALLRSGDVKVGVPLSGAISELGIDVVKFPPGSKLELSLSVRDGKIVGKDTTAVLTGGVRAVGVEVLGAHLDDKLHVYADLEVMGRKVSVRVPGVKVPADMNQLAALAAKTSPKGADPGKRSGATDLVDLSHAQLDVSNATFGAGRIGLPGGAVDIAEGSKLSFHGTPMKGELLGTVGLNAVSLTRDDVAMKGSGGRAELRLAYRRDGDQAVVDGSLSNLSMSTDYVVRKAADGDYVSLGAGRIAGGSVSLHAQVPVDANGLPKLTAMPTLSDASLNVSSFVGDLKSARMTSTGQPGGEVELGASHVEGAVGFSQEKGVTLKATVDSVNAQVSGVQVRQKGASLDVEHARLQGRSGTVDLGPNKLTVDAKQLAWDATVREVDTKTNKASLKAGQVHVSGEGRFSYDSQQDLKVEGRLHIDGNGSGDVKAVTVNRRTGVAVRR